MNVFFSTTAVQTGFGSAKWKKVTFLTKEERAAVRAGDVVLFDSGRPCGGNHGTTLRMVLDRGSYRFQPRVPDDGLIEIINNPHQFATDATAGVVADWYEEKGLNQAAQYLRGRQVA